MATTKPRLILTLEPDQYALVKRLAKLQGRPSSRVVSEFLEVAWPTLAAVADALEQASQIQASQLSSLQQSVSKADSVALDLLAGLVQLSKAQKEVH